MVDTNTHPQTKYLTMKKLANCTTIILLAVSVAYIHYKYVSILFENDRNFSYLSELEREMSFRTEMGFYYSYYKTITEVNPLYAAISKLSYDKLVEYPNEVDAFKRFNIHPEVMIGVLYRSLEPWLNTTSYRQCHMLDRGEGLTLVESCTGLGQPVFFYLEVIWWLAGLTVAALFLHATLLSESILGGVLAVVQYFTNHSECTRVQWAPNERENFALPLLLLQTWMVSIYLRDEKKSSTAIGAAIFVLNFFCLLSWQFTQFIFLVQILVFFMMEQMKIIDNRSLCILLHLHFCGINLAFLALHGNPMLQSSLYVCVFAGLTVYCCLFSTLRVKVQNRLDLFFESCLVLVRLYVIVSSAFYLKKVLGDILQLQEDSHVWDILISKFSDFKTFHTLLYTCSEVFDFLPWSSYRKLFISFLTPTVILAISNVCKHWNYKAKVDMEVQRESETDNEAIELEKDSTTDEEADDSGIENSTNPTVKPRQNDLDLTESVIKAKIEDPVIKDKFVLFLEHLSIDPAIFYNLSLLAVYGVMAALVMRLKLLFVTQMCIISSLIMNRKYYVLPKSYMKLLPFFWFLVMIQLMHHLYENVSEEMSHLGEFIDIQQEQLMEWIKSETGKTEAFAGSMPVLATVMLVARRPIVAHPHYEHTHARDRAYSVYKTYGRFTPMDLYQELNRLKASYLILEAKYCYGRSRKGCTFQDIWDLEKPSLRHQPSLCHTLLESHVDHFYPVFRNKQYAVYKIHDYSVRYMPRNFDT